MLLNLVLGTQLSFKYNPQRPTKRSQFAFSRTLLSLLMHLFMVAFLIWRFLLVFCFSLLVFTSNNSLISKIFHLQPLPKITLKGWLGLQFLPKSIKCHVGVINLSSTPINSKAK